MAAVVTDVGPSGLTLAAVGAKVGLTGPALGYRFKTKHGLLVAFAAAQPGITAQHFDRVQAGANSPADAIVEALVTMIRGMDSKQAVANHLAMLHLDLTDKDLGRYAGEQATIIREGLDRLLDKAGLNDGPHRATVADDLYVIWSGAITTWAINGSGSLVDWVQQRLHRRLATEALR